MNYQKIYNSLVSKTYTDDYTEVHHIIPKCLGGTNDKDNLVRLSPEAHYLAHQLLVKIHPDNHKLVYAVNMMTMNLQGKRQNNKLFGWLRRRASEYRKEWLLEHGHPKGMLGKHHKLENINKITSGIKQKAIEKRIEVYTYNLDGSFYKKYDSLIECALDLKTNASNVKYTAEGNFGHCKQKQIRYEFFENIEPYVKPSPLKGKKKTEEHKLNQSKAMKGRTRSDAWKAAHSNAMKKYHAEKKETV
jgi:hypothetical protein